MTETKGVCAEISANSSLNDGKEETNNNAFVLEGVTECETSDFLEESGNFCDYSGDCSKGDFDELNDSDVIHSFIQNTSDEAEATLWAKRQARAEAREIRMRELERQQKKEEENADRQLDMLGEPLSRTPRSTTASSRYLSSQRSSEDSLEDRGSHKELREAEARLWAKRQARAEAREIRLRELERQQKEQEENADRQFDMLADPLTRTPRGTTAGSRYLSSRRSSEDSLEDGGSLRELRVHELKEVEEKFRKAMIANAQLDNDKAAQTYQLELLKDRLEELEEDHSQLKREHREKCREHDQLKRLCAKLKDDLAVTRAELEERDRLIAEKGLVIVGEEVPPDEDGTLHPPRKALVSVENAQLLESAGDGSLDVRLEKFAKEKCELQDQISHLKLELEEERSKRRKPSSTGFLNGPSSDYDFDDIQREASKQLADYKFRAQKAEQDVATLQATVARLESQVIRYKTAAEVSEQSEEALKAEKRKLQREESDSLTDLSTDVSESY